jgi:hypothetical protein
MTFPDLQFSYSQFFLYDAAIPSPACIWTERHSKQGFARRDGVVAVGTVLEFGSAAVALVVDRPSNVQQYQRALAVPLHIRSGSLAIDGPEESPGVRKVPMATGFYRVTIGQNVLDDLREEVTIWLERSDIPFARSELLVVDENLDPSEPLLETADEP